MATPSQSSGYPPISDYALLGDCHTAALVSRDGAIDWFCPTRFDAPAVVCRLLDWHRGGYQRVAPTEAYQVARQYRGPTSILDTTFTTASGQVRLTDFRPIYSRQASPEGYDVGTSGHTLRLIEALSGEVELAVEFKPTFDFARAATQVTPVAGRGAVAQANGSYVTLACPGLTLVPDGAGGWRGTLRVRAGQRQWLALVPSSDAAGARQALDAPDGDARLAETLAYWQRWAARCTYQGRYRDAVLRSALTLKLLTYEPTGAIVAAPTTSLPELIGGPRNWDYRYTWIRDTSLILYALVSVGYVAEALDFYHWLHDIGARAGGDIQIMYGIHGERDLAESTIGDLEGYRGSRPVRVGNGAATQHQLDIYGELLTAADLYLTATRTPDGQAASTRTAETDILAHPIVAGWPVFRRLAEHAATSWQKPDSGIWEVRGGPQPFLYSRLMCWAALDRARSIAQRFGLPAPQAQWQRTQQAIRQAILTQGFDERSGAFTQALGSAVLDSSVLAIPRVGFLPATDPRVQSTVQRIQQDLMGGGLVYRYRTDETADGLTGAEGTFALCSFWLVDALALGGQLDAAHALFEHVLSFANDVGLLSEEIEPTSGTLLGNFPQGFSHLALISSAVNLAKAAKHGPEQRAETEAGRMLSARGAAAAG
jgi:GH15 family glucan-1,4-alpha-glucosidase